MSVTNNRFNAAITPETHRCICSSTGAPADLPHTALLSPTAEVQCCAVTHAMGQLIGCLSSANPWLFSNHHVNVF